MKPVKYPCKGYSGGALPLPRMREGRSAHRCAWPCSMSQTSQYYNDHATTFFEATVGVDMGPLHARFLQNIPAGGRILDAGCGSGRDARAFKDLGFEVEAFDASPELAKLASTHLGHTVRVRTFSDVSEVHAYDGIWACASLLHLRHARESLPPCTSCGRRSNQVVRST